MSTINIKKELFEVLQEGHFVFRLGSVNFDYKTICLRNILA